MPKFIDHHLMPEMSPDKMKAMLEKTRSAIISKKADKYGVVWLNAFMAGQESWGYTEAPNAEAIVKSHKDLGIKVDLKDVKEVTSLV